MNAIVPAGHVQTSPGSALVPRNFDEAFRLAGMMARAKIGIPAHLRNDDASCFLVVEQATRWGMSPIAVAQCTSKIGDKLMYEGKLVAAAAASSGAIVSEFDYEYSGDPTKPDTLSVVVRATRASDRQVKEITLRWLDAKTANEFWKKQPEQQLAYAGSRVWTRRWTPGVLLGVYAPEEFEDQPERFSGTTINAEPLTNGQIMGDEIPARVMEPKRTIRQFLDEFQAEMAEAMAAVDPRAAFDVIMTRPDVQKAEAGLTNGAKERFDGIVQTAVAQLAERDEAEANAA